MSYSSLCRLSRVEVPWHPAPSLSPKQAHFSNHCSKSQCLKKKVTKLLRNTQRKGRFYLLVFQTQSHVRDLWVVSSLHTGFPWGIWEGGGESQHIKIRWFPVLKYCNFLTSFNTQEDASALGPPLEWQPPSGSGSDRSLCTRPESPVHPILSTLFTSNGRVHLPSGFACIFVLL